VDERDGIRSIGNSHPDEFGGDDIGVHHAGRISSLGGGTPHLFIRALVRGGDDHDGLIIGIF